MLRPLGMVDSTFAQPIPEPLAARMARAFPCPDASCPPVPLDYRNAPPAGALVTTPDDMSRFLLAMLRPGASAVGSEPVALLTARAWAHRPELPGIALALQEQRIAGSRGLVHAARSSGYLSLLAIVPESNAALFVVTTGGSSSFGTEILAEFESLLPQTGTADVAARPRSLSAAEIDEYRGSYLLGRASKSGYESFPGRFAFGHRIGADDGGLLTRLEAGEVRRYGLVGEDLFAAVDGPAMMAFERDPAGRIAALHAADVFNGVRYPATYERLPLWGEPPFLNELLSWAMGLPVMALLAWAAVLGVRRLHRWRSKGRGRPVEPHRRTALAWAVLGLVLIGVVAIWLFGFGFMAKFNAMATTRPEALVYGLPEELGRLLWLPWLIGACSAALAGTAVAGWLLRESLELIDRLLVTLVAACALLFTALLVHFRLLPPAA